MCFFNFAEARIPRRADRGTTYASPDSGVDGTAVRVRMGGL